MRCICAAAVCAVCFEFISFTKFNDLMMMVDGPISPLNNALIPITDAATSPISFFPPLSTTVWTKFIVGVRDMAADQRIENKQTERRRTVHENCAQKCATDVTDIVIIIIIVSNGSVSSRIGCAVYGCLPTIWPPITHYLSMSGPDMGIFTIGIDMRTDNGHSVFTVQLFMFMCNGSVDLPFIQSFIRYYYLWRLKIESWIG